jgi:hypothetical protein
VDVELLEDLLNVPRHGLGTDHEALGDISRLEALPSE